METTPIRANTLVIATAELAETLQAAGFEAVRLAWCEEALTVRGVSSRQLTALPEYERGAFFIQNHSSLVPVLALAPQPEQTILDLCAAPGGKTTHIAACLKNQGEIIANDISQQRVYKLANVLKQYAVTCARTSRMPGHLIWQLYTDYFDGVLVDAPCSMRGTAEHSPSEVKSLAKQQKFLLKSALSAAKPGGVIVYSTCTTTVEENESVIEWLLEKHPGQVSVEPLELPGVPFAPALTEDAKGHAFSASIAHTRRILPTLELEGFFVAKLRKSNSP